MFNQQKVLACKFDFKNDIINGNSPFFVNVIHKLKFWIDLIFLKDHALNDFVHEIRIVSIFELFTVVDAASLCVS